MKLAKTMMIGISGIALLLSGCGGDSKPAPANSAEVLSIAQAQQAAQNGLSQGQYILTAMLAPFKLIAGKNDQNPSLSKDELTVAVVKFTPEPILSPDPALLEIVEVLPVINFPIRLDPIKPIEIKPISLAGLTSKFVLIEQPIDVVVKEPTVAQLKEVTLDGNLVLERKATQNETLLKVTCDNGPGAIKFVGAATEGSWEFVNYCHGDITLDGVVKYSIEKTAVGVITLSLSFQDVNIQTPDGDLMLSGTATLNADLPNRDFELAIAATVTGTDDNVYKLDDVLVKLSLESPGAVVSITGEVTDPVYGAISIETQQALALPDFHILPVDGVILLTKASGEVITVDFTGASDTVSLKTDPGGENEKVIEEEFVWK